MSEQINRLKALLLERKAHWEQISEASGVSVRTIYRLVNGEGRPFHETIDKLLVAARKVYR